MRIAIFGATGSVGKLLVRQALDAGYEVRAFVRNPEKLALNHAQLTVIQGDVLHDHAQIQSAVAGSDAVIVALGAGAKGKVRSQGTQNVIAAMRQAGVRDLICQSTPE